MKPFNRNGFVKKIAFMTTVMIVVLMTSSHWSCQSVEEATDSDTACPAGQWAIDTANYYAYRHDCSPYHSTHFTVYSDGGSLEAKQQLAGIAEEVFAELVPEFLVTDIERELGFTAGYTYYIFAEKYVDAVAMGFRNGFYIAAIDSALVPDVYSRDPRNYRYVIKHELSHVFQFTFTDCPTLEDCPDWLEVWFREGQAIVMGGMGEEIRVNSLGELQEWIADPDRVNPISIRRSTDYPEQQGGYYAMFALAYTYLVDSRFGRGHTVEDMRYMFELMAQGDPFEEAFESALGLNVQFFQNHFYAWMSEYLRRTQRAGNGNGTVHSVDLNYIGERY
jgi:hypothetical protein